MIGQSLKRVDGLAKVRGEFEYASDLWAPGMLWGATLRSPHAHAAILAIDTRLALATPGVEAVLTAADVPGQLSFGLEFADQPALAAGVVRYEGEPVAVVAATDPETARRAAAAIRVTYEPLPVVDDMVAAMEPGTPRLHGYGNVLRHVHIRHGDEDPEADVWIEGYYETAMQDNAPLGPEGGLAIPQEDGGVHLRVNTQWLHVDRHQIALCLGLPDEKVRITLAGMGGAFGAREDIHLQIHACLLALRTGRPVKIVYGREESFHGHMHRHPARLWMRHGATRDGRLVCVKVRFFLDGGAYASSSPAVLGNASTFAAGPYEVPNVQVDGTVVYTNNPPCGAMRGFGAPQVCFAHEAQMDKLARRLDLDPLELRLRNVLQTGSVLPTGLPIRGSAPARELLERLRELPLPDSPPEQPGGTGNVGRGERVTRGVGYALGYKNVAYSEGFDDSAEARIRLYAGPHGAEAEIFTAAVDCGQGLSTVLTQVARGELGLENVHFPPADSSLVGSAGSTSASRQTTMAGGAVSMVCRQAVDEVRSRLASRYGAVQPEMPVTFADGEVLLGGEPVAPVADLLDLPVLSTAVYHHRATSGFDQDGQGDIHVSLVFGAERAVVDVDAELGLVKVVEVAAVQDVGRAVNPAGIEGQMEGGTAQGLGLATMEEIVLKEGRMQNASFTDYHIPTILDVPRVITEIVEEPEPGAPYGVKGIAESPTIVATAAVVAAIRDATGRELNRAPVLPDDVAGLRGPVDRGPWPPLPPPPWQTPVPEVAGLGVGQQKLMRKD